MAGNELAAAAVMLLATSSAAAVAAALHTSYNNKCVLLDQAI